MGAIFTEEKDPAKQQRIQALGEAFAKFRPPAQTAARSTLSNAAPSSLSNTGQQGALRPASRRGGAR